MLVYFLFTSFLARNLSPNKVMTDTNIGGVSEAIGGSSNSVGIAAIDTNTSIDLGFSFTFAIAIDTITIARNRVVVSIHTGSTLQSNTIAMDKLGFSISFSLTIETHTIATIAIARNRVVVSIHTGGTL